MSHKHTSRVRVPTPQLLLYYFNLMLNDKPLTKEEREQKVYRLCHELEEMKQKKKASSRGFSEEIKRIEDEIKDLLDPVSLED